MTPETESETGTTWVDFRTFRDQVDVFDRIELEIENTAFYDPVQRGFDLKHIRDLLDPICTGTWSVGYLGEVIYFSNEEDYNLVRLIYG